jgi:Membrane domain of glycerophosphoryl diester phosphodiesterase
LDDVFGGAFALVRLYWRTMVPFTLLISAPFAFASAFFTRNLPTIAEIVRRSAEGLQPTNAYAGYPGAYWAVLILRDIVGTAFIAFGLVQMVAVAMKGGAPTAKRAIGGARLLLGRLLWTFTLSSLVTSGIFIGSSFLRRGEGGSPSTVGLLEPSVRLAAIVLGFILSVRLLFVAQVLVIEHRSGLSALRRSWQVSDGSFWKLVGNVLVVGLCLVVVLGILTFVPEELSRSNGGAWWLLSGLGSTLSAAIATPFSTAAGMLLYIHCRVKKEGSDLDLGQQVGPVRSGS